MGAPLLGLAGYAKAGKDWFADLLVDGHGWHRLAFADRLKALAYDLDPIVGAPKRPGAQALRLQDEVVLSGWAEAKQAPEVRALLQRLGVAVREYVDPHAWVRPVIDEAQALRADGVPVVVSDVRFDNEVDAIRQVGGLVALKRRPGCAPANGHVSEQLAGRDDEFFDAVVCTPHLDGLPDVAARIDRWARGVSE